ncbi:MAG TPA: transposase [Kofleriaceae bacterium]
MVGSRGRERFEGRRAACRSCVDWPWNDGVLDRRFLIFAVDVFPENGYQECVKASAKRTRKRHVQQELFRRGGKRKGAGRKPKGARAGSRHRARPAIKPYHALHVVMRVVPAVGSMRRRTLYKALRDATITAALRERFRIVHVSIQRTHVHMLVEAENTLALARGMQGFQISAARHINTALAAGYRRRRGPVFADRYHVEVITSPMRARNALSYVLNNWRRHREDQRGLASTWLVDPFSSGISFPDWKELEDKALMWPIRETYDPLVVRRPQSWLLREGWKRCGVISARDVPSKRP